MYTYSEIFRNKNEGRKIPSKKRKKRDANHRLSMKIMLHRLFEGTTLPWTWSSRMIDGQLSRSSARSRSRGVESGRIYMYRVGGPREARTRVYPIRALHRLPARPTRIIILTIMRTTSRPSPINEREREGSSSELEWKKSIRHGTRYSRKKNEIETIVPRSKSAIK